MNKITKLILPLTGLAALGGTITSLTSCNCSGSNDSWENVPEENIFSECGWEKDSIRIYANNLKKGVTYQANISFSDLSSNSGITYGSIYMFGILCDEQMSSNQTSSNGGSTFNWYNSVDHARLKINDKVFSDLKEYDGDLSFPTPNKEFMYLNWKDMDPDGSGWAFMGCKDHDDLTAKFEQTDTISFQFQVIDDIDSAQICFQMYTPAGY